jgi:hypothetical protein
MADTNEPNEEIPEDLTRIKKALLAEREGHKATKKLLVAANARIGQIDTLGANPHVEQVKSFIDVGIAAGVALKSAALTAQVTTLETQLAAANKLAADATGTLASRTVADEIRDACRAQFVKPEALGDAIAIGSTELKLIDGEVKTAEGLSAADWVEARKSVSGFWWPVSRGAGSRGNAQLDGLVDVGPNPFAAGSWNLTKQGELMQSNPTMAARLQAQAQN